MRFIFSLFFVLGIAIAGHAQLNLSVHYSTGLTQPKTHQKIIDRFHQSNPWLQTTFKDIRWVNGYGLGLRYKFDRLAFDFKWENLIDRISASGTNPVGDVAFKQTLFLKLSSYSFGIESFFTEKLSIHASYDFNKVRYRTELSGVEDKFELMNDWGMGSTFSIGYNFIGSGLMHVSVRPYIHLSWTNHDLSALDASLNPSAPEDLELEEEFLNFGLKLIFYNGEW